MVDERTFTLKGNDLAWILKLAQSHLATEKFIDSMKKYPEVTRYLRDLLAPFHELNLNTGGSETIWTLTNTTDPRITNALQWIQEFSQKPWNNDDTQTITAQELTQLENTLKTQPKQEKNPK